jgi:acyl-CoA synthetase (AMP-forming)/AMP-acid ligase II
VFAPFNARLAAKEVAPVVDLADPALMVTDESRRTQGDVTLDELLDAADAVRASPPAVSLDERDPHDPAVAEAAVVGLADPDWGERVCAVVVLKQGSELDLDGLRRHLSGRLASFKHPRRLVITRGLPRTAATGQVQRTLLAEQLSLTSQME